MNKEAQILAKEPSALLKICCIGELKRTRKRENITSNGQIAY